MKIKIRLYQLIQPSGGLSYTSDIPRKQYQKPTSHVIIPNRILRQLGTKANETKILEYFGINKVIHLSQKYPISVNTSPKETYCKHQLQYMTHQDLFLCLLTRKVNCRNFCDLKIPWDKEIPRENQNQWLKWTRGLHDQIKQPKLIPNKVKKYLKSIFTCLVMQV